MKLAFERGFGPHMGNVVQIPQWLVVLVVSVEPIFTLSKGKYRFDTDNKNSIYFFDYPIKVHIDPFKKGVFSLLFNMLFSTCQWM